MQTLPASTAGTEFEQKILERLRNDIRELLPEDALKKLVERAVDETFFKERRIEGRYGGMERIDPGWFVTEVTKSAEPMIREAVEQFVADRRDVIQQAIDKFLTNEQLSIQIATRLASMLNDTFNSAINRMSNGRY
jgi:hypothetical protein